MEFVNRMMAELKVSKEVKGNLGSKVQLFAFTMTLTKADGSPYTDTIPDPDGISSWATTGNGVYTFKMRHGDEFTLSLPHGTNYTITEQPLDYSAKVKLTENGRTVSNTAASTISGVTDAEKVTSEVAFTNTRSSPIPTGINDLPTIGAWLAVILAAVAMVTGTFMIRKKRKITK